MADDQEKITKAEGEASHEEHGFSVGVGPVEDAEIVNQTPTPAEGVGAAALAGGDSGREPMPTSEAQGSAALRPGEENFVENSDKARELAATEDPAMTAAGIDKKYASRIENNSAEEAATYRERAEQKEIEAGKASDRVGLIYDLRKFLEEHKDTEQQYPEETARLHSEILEEAKKTEAELDTSGFTREQTVLNACERMLQLGERSALLKAVDIIENPKSERFTDSYGRGEGNKQLRYRDLAIAAYEGGLIEEAQHLEPLITYKGDYLAPLLFAKAEAVESTIPELLEVVESSAPHIQGQYSRLASRMIKRGNLEAARQLAERLEGETKSRTLAKLVEAGDTGSAEMAREAALKLTKEVGQSKEEIQVGALIRLYEAGDDESLPVAMEIINSYDYPVGKLELLAWLDRTVRQRAQRLAKSTETEHQPA